MNESNRPLNLACANEIIANALVRARELRLRPLVVVVVDLSGCLQAMQREDGASMYRFDVARGKAWGCVANKMPSRGLADRAQQNPNFMLSLAPTAAGRFLPQPGGVLIRDASGRLLGAAGASGGTGDEDEAVCAHGITQAGFVSDPVF